MTTIPTDQRATKLDYAVALAALFFFLVIATFITNSYPWMYPGYDVWWHLGVINTDSAYHPTMHQYARWHRIWDHVFDTFNINNIWSKALIIHRVQILITALCLFASSCLIFRSIFKEATVTTTSVLAGALLATILWALMTGTYSSAHFGGRDSATTQSWLMWYSVNYQISLPFYYLASASLLKLATGIESRTAFWSLVTVTIASGALILFFHAAEFSYLIWATLLIIAIFGTWNQRLRYFLIFTVLVAALLIALPHISHRLPELPALLIQGKFSDLAQLIVSNGEIMSKGRNRWITGWTILHTLSIGSLSAVYFLTMRNRESSVADSRSIALLILISISPFIIFFKTSAGLFTTITNLEIAWRFAFASLVFVGIPLFLIHILATIKQHDNTFQLKLATLCLILLSAVATTGNWDTVSNYWTSLHRSLSPERSYFQISKNNLSTLNTASAAITKNPGNYCFDIFSTYYLFHILKVNNICLPGAISSLPNVGSVSGINDNCKCSFPRGDEPYISLGLVAPKWKYNANE